MKKVLLALVVAVLPLSVSAQQQANALPEGFYASLGAGYSDLSLHKSSIVTFTKFDDSDTAFKLALGYQFNQNFATEFTYARLGEADTANTTVPGSSKNKVSAYALAAKLYPTISAPVKPFVKLGINRLTNKESGEDKGTPYSYKESKTNALYGIGVEWLLTPKMRIGLEYESYGKAGTTDINESKSIEVKPSLISVTLTASF